MSTAEIIREIERLPLKEKAEVLSALLRSKANNSKLSPDELVALADQMVAAKDREDADRLEARFLQAFTADNQWLGFGASVFLNR